MGEHTSFLHPSILENAAMPTPMPPSLWLAGGRIGIIIIFLQFCGAIMIYSRKLIGQIRKIFALHSSMQNWPFFAQSSYIVGRVYKICNILRKTTINDGHQLRIIAKSSSKDYSTIKAKDTKSRNVNTYLNVFL